MKHTTSSSCPWFPRERGRSRLGRLAVMAGGSIWAACGPSAQGARFDEAPPLPAPVSNNAVAAIETSSGFSVFSFLGVDSTKTWDGVTTASYRWDVGGSAWREIDPPPGPGRLAATAQALAGRIFLFGGYTVAEDGSERSVPQVDVFDPETERWSSASPIPIPVDDAVSAVWRDTLIYLVSGWHDSDNVGAVQVFDPAADIWSAATPIPGPPVFGHAGGIAGDVIVYVDGARVDRDPRGFSLESSSWLGRIDPGRPTQIEWEPLEDHPGRGLYRAAAVGHGRRVYFLAGTDNPYNYNGIGYDGRPAEPLVSTFAFDVDASAWVELAPLASPTMDHRGIALAGSRAFVIGGMAVGQRVTARVAEVRLR